MDLDSLSEFEQYTRPASFPRSICAAPSILIRITLLRGPLASLTNGRRTILALHDIKGDSQRSRHSLGDQS